jgi:hypothetical protein
MLGLDNVHDQMVQMDSGSISGYLMAKKITEILIVKHATRSDLSRYSKHSEFFNRRLLELSNKVDSLDAKNINQYRLLINFLRARDLNLMKALITILEELSIVI